MAYWVKEITFVDYCYNEDGDKIEYTYTKYVGPFRSLSDAESELQNTNQCYEVVDFDG